ncbi:transposase [Amycolatopsis rubida]|uniref:transposase n=1 Tax=Amycolatopsis rubida TaxID=112413 RepID=UPI001AD7F8D8|nr:transposase [Amycolatopsis rubida]
MTNLFAALHIGTGEASGECCPVRDAANFLTFLEKAVKPHAGKEIHGVLDNLSTHPAPGIQKWLAANPNVRLHFTPNGAAWVNQIETWFGIITRQSIRRGTFTSGKSNRSATTSPTGTPTPSPSPRPPPQRRSRPRSASSMPTSKSSSTTTESKNIRFTRH